MTFECDGPETAPWLSLLGKTLYLKSPEFKGIETLGQVYSHGRLGVFKKALNSKGLKRARP
jgi:hypothetical protein